MAFMSEITPQNIDPSMLAQNAYLTPRAAETAIGTGILAVRPNIAVIREVRNYLNEQVGSSYEYLRT